MATGRDDFVIAFRSAFLKKKDKQKFSLFSLILLSIIVIILSNINFKPIKFIKIGINEIIYRSSYIASKPENYLQKLTVKIKNHINLFENYNSSDLDSAKQNLKNQLSKYLPSVRLVDAKFIQTDEDQDGSSVIFRITYYVELLGITEEIDFGLDSGKKSFFPILHRRDKLGRVL